MEDPTGFDDERVTAWLAERVAGLQPPLRWTKLPGGHSNFTYRVDDAAGRDLRAAPSAARRAAPHGPRHGPRVHRDLGAVADPGARARSRWPTPTTRRSPARSSTPWAGSRAAPSTRPRTPRSTSTAEARARTGPSFIDTLAALHGLDPDEIGLGGLGKRTSYVGRQLHRWYESWNASKDRELPDVDRLYDFLVERLPEQATVSVVHGDYGLHNCRVATDGHIAAVVDWEISTLGDPMADLAYCINAWVESPDETERRRPTAHDAARASAGRQELLDRYADRTGADLSQHRLLPLLQPLEVGVHRAGRVRPLPPRPEGERRRRPGRSSRCASSAACAWPSRRRSGCRPDRAGV